ncbi:MAG TPA: N-methyl-L-tryptophan oxidase [Candidatus Krumholzibacteria bacterium]
MERFDVIVAGLGAMGSAALHHLARSGVRAAGFDRFAPPHALGSSHGETRMIREAYYEHPAYVPLVRRAYQLWHELSLPGDPLIVETGGPYAGPPDGELVPGIRRSAELHAIPIETLSHSDASRRFPWLHFDSSMEIVAEPRAGFVHPERCIARHLEEAAKDGAEIHADEPVLEWRHDGGGVVVRTARGEYAAAKLVLATGAWMVDALAEIGVTTVVERQPLFWFAPRAGAPKPTTVWAIEFEHGKLLYGFPATDAGIKVAIHYGGVQRTTAEQIDRRINDDDSRHLRRFTDQYMPGVLGEIIDGQVCMYTNTPDLHFIFDAHPRHGNVLVVSACSGHGFKFSSAIGEAAAQWATEGAPRIDMSLFALSRLLG